MKTQTERRMHGSSALPKTTGLFALVFFLLAFVGQALHSHLPPQGRAHAAEHIVLGSTSADASTDDGNAETCPLCVAMHSAVPVSEAASTAGYCVVAGTVAAVAEVFPDDHVAFAQLSRPPPAL